MMSRSILLVIYFFYGLAFFSMGMIVALEGGRGSDQRLRHALRPLAVFGIIHGLHEWLEIFILLEALPFYQGGQLAWTGLRLAIQAFSFLSLTAFGASLLSQTERIRRLSLLVPLGQVAVWGFGLLIMRSRYAFETDLWDVAFVWTRYVLGIPASLFACAGLIAQQRHFRLAGMAQFGRDSLWAAIAFAWYGLIGQLFTNPSPLPPSDFLNQNLFLDYFGVPIQVVRALAAALASAFVVRFLRAFEVENQRKLAELGELRLRAAEDREALAADLLRRVVAAQESERQRVARELHDETGQALTAIGLGLRGVSGSLQANPEQAARTLGQLEKLVSSSLDELQRLIADLRPSHIDDLGLAAAIRWYAGEFQNRTSLPVSVEISGERQEVPPPVKIALFRIVQEALNNAFKYAQATGVKVGLQFGEVGVTVIVQDDGRGFDPVRVERTQRSSWGLLGMRERATLLGGRFELDTAPGKGTRIQVSIPYQTDTEGEPHDNTTSAGG